jgi:ankyrin repeat protein
LIIEIQQNTTKYIKIIYKMDKISKVLLIIYAVIGLANATATKLVDNNTTNSMSGVIAVNSTYCSNSTVPYISDAFALNTTNSMSDLFALNTSSEPVGSYWVIDDTNKCIVDGSKWPKTRNSDYNDWIVCDKDGEAFAYWRIIHDNGAESTGHSHIGFNKHLLELDKQRQKDSDQIAMLVLSGLTVMCLYKLFSTNWVHGQTLLMIACFYGYENVVKSLLIAGASLDIQNEHGQTALMIAEAHNHDNIVKLIKEWPIYMGLAAFNDVTKNNYLRLYVVDDPYVVKDLNEYLNGPSNVLG